MQPRSKPPAVVARQKREPIGSCSASGCGQAGQEAAAAVAVESSCRSEVSAVCVVDVEAVMAAA
jgi:hypothetical protein